MGTNNAALVRERVNAVYTMLISGATRRQVIQFASESEWNVSDRTVDSYIKRANERLEAAAETQHKRELGLARQRLDLLFHRSLKLQDYRTCLSIQKEINDLLDLSLVDRSMPHVTVNVSWDNDHDDDDDHLT